MSASSFRTFLDDVYLETYMYLYQTYSAQGTSHFHQLVIDYIQQASDDVVRIEACLHLLKAVEPALKDTPQANEFVKQFFEQLYGPLRAKLADPYNVALKKGYCLLVGELASLFTKMPQLLGETIRATLSTSESI